MQRQVLQQQQSLKCGCEKYFPSPLFKNKCSMCFQKEFPEEWKQHIRDTWCPAYSIPSYKLEEFVDTHKISSNKWLKLLVNIIKDENALLNVLPHMLFSLKKDMKDFYGFSAEDAGELYYIFRTRYKDKFGDEGSGSNSDFKWQHLFGGLIFDTWNIKSDVNGPIAYCYYGNFGSKPRGSLDNIVPSAWMKETRRTKIWINNVPPTFKVIFEKNQ